MFFFFNDTATTEIYTLSLHDALPIYVGKVSLQLVGGLKLEKAKMHRMTDVKKQYYEIVGGSMVLTDRKSTRLNSSHANISHAVFCLKKKKIIRNLRYH